MKLRTYIIEDEPPARNRLRQLLADEPDVDCIGESDGSADLLDRLRRERPDVIFLDLHIPRIHGFEILRQLRLDPPPAVIVTTAHPDHAVEAFDHEITDYLLKPFHARRLRSALERARRHLAPRAIAPEPPAPAPDEPHLVRFVVRNDKQLEVVCADQVDWLAAAGNYVVLHAGRENHVLRESLGTLETRLDPATFVRISRSSLVRLDRIKKITTGENGNVSVTLADGTQLPLTRGIRELQERLEHGRAPVALSRHAVQLHSRTGRGRRRAAE